MATGGWGAVGGAWGGGGGAQPTGHVPQYEEMDTPASKASSAPLYAGQSDAGSYAPSQQQPSAGFAGAFKSAFGKSKSEAPPAHQSYGQPSSAFDGVPSGPAYNSGGIGSGNIAAKEAELAAREKALNAKEQELKKLESELVKSGALKKKNWPRCYPLIYHNIVEEIPEKERRVVREVYIAWYGLVVCMTWNFFCASVMLGYDVDQKVSSWFLAVIYAITGIPLSFIFWYRKLYNGAKHDSTFGYLSFFIMFVIHLGFCVWAAIAVPFSAEKWSFAGFITALTAFDTSTFAGVIYIIGACLWSIEALYTLWCLKDVWFFFRGMGGVQEVKQKAALEAFKSTMTRGNNNV